MTGLDCDGRQSIWAAYDIEASLQKMAALHAAIDFSTLDGTRPAVELRWLDGIPEDAACSARTLVEQGQSCFSARALIQCAKEAIEFGRDATDLPISDFDLLRCVTAIHAEHDRPRRLAGLPEIDDVGPESLKTITEYFEA